MHVKILRSDILIYNYFYPVSCQCHALCLQGPSIMLLKSLILWYMIMAETGDDICQKSL